jgi:hypothetical protein
MELFGIEFGTWGEWFGAAAALAGTVLSIFALIIAKQANKLSQKTNEAARELERERDIREQDRDRKAVAASLLAWWVREDNEQGAPPRWGIMLSNKNGGSTVFRRVSLRAECNGREFQSLSEPLEFLPPGEYFIENTSNSFPEFLQKDRVYTPDTRSKKHIVKELRFTDQIGCEWVWTPEKGLVNASQEKVHAI